MIGWVLGVVGIAPQVLAFADAPFVVVQPALASGLLILLFIGSRMFDEHVDWVEIVGVSAIIGGVALVAWGAPQHTEAHRSGAAVIAVVAALAAVGFFPFVVRGTRWDTGMGSIIASGAGFAASNVATKLLSDDIGTGHYVVAAVWAAVGLITRHRSDDHRDDCVPATTCDDGRPGQHGSPDVSADRPGAVLPSRALDVGEVRRRADRRRPADRARRHGRRLTDASRQRAIGGDAELGGLAAAPSANTCRRPCPTTAR